MHNVEEFAEILRVMIERGLLQHPDFNRTVGVLIRDAMETTHPHCTTNYRSVKAAQVVNALPPRSRAQYQKRCQSKENSLRHEHMVPTSERIRILAAMEDPTTEAIAHSLRTFGLRATIHRDEDEVLNKAKLKSRMPAAFWDKDRPDMYMNPLARYIATDLLANLRPRQGNCWFADEQLPD